MHNSRHETISPSAASSDSQQRRKYDKLESTRGSHNYLSQQSVAFFLLGTLVGLPCTTITAAAKALFHGVTGAYGLCAFVTAALTSFVTPMFAHHIPLSYRTIILTVTGLASLGICGATYAFGINTYLAVAASFPQYTVVSFSSGCGFSVVLGPALYIILMGALGQSWKKVFMVCLCFPALICAVWWSLLDESGRRDAERVRRLAVTKEGSLECGSGDSIYLQNRSHDSLPVAEETKTGFGSGISRTGLFIRIILPRYVIPLLLCTTSAIVSLLGLSPTFQNLNLFQGSPKGDLQFEIYYLSYGMGQFLGSVLSMKVRLTFIWGWAAVQISIVAIVFMFMVGICAGGGITNTNYKIADDFRQQNQPEEVRSFAMSYGGLGNFSGDALGGCLAILIEVLAKKHLEVRT
ncbi:Protein BTN1-like protein 2 [Stagonosporopsis vannaccii]|nr:Protein BTN1-like protein 2 [Stagonosporopsis vannaccii]